MCVRIAKACHQLIRPVKVTATTMDTFSALQSAVSASLVSTTRTVSAISAEDLPFHRSLTPALATSLDRQNARLLALASRLLGTATANTEAARPPRISDIESVEGNWGAVVDVVDSLLERADTALDEFTGAVKRLSPGAVEQAAARQQQSSKGKNGAAAATVWRAQEIEKPQLKFDHVPNNDEEGPFKPLLKAKPHAVTPWEESEDLEEYAHPYHTEIEQYVYPASVYTHAEPIPYHPFETTTAIFVDTEAALRTMLEDLESATELAVDLEHHDQRSYIGLVSLMQISTRDQDYIVDTLAPPVRRNLSILNSVFADPKILKVLHGAYMDIMWLQRDLGLYVVGLFDTHYASRALGYPGGSLAYLLQRFAGVEAQKQYQLADWRVRPLGQALFDYARSDTHYLLYIFDNMRNELIARSDLSLPDQEGDKLHDVLIRSSETALQRYEHPVYDQELGQGGMGWYKMLSKTPALLNKEQFAVFRAVHHWRDRVAREQDDSTHFIMPNHAILNLAKQIPITRQDVMGMAHPITASVRSRIDELVTVIIDAKTTGNEGPEMMEVLQKIEPQGRFERRAGREAAPAAPSHTVAQFVPGREAQAETAAEAMPTSLLPLRSATSTFWGASLPVGIAQSQQSRALPDINLTIDLPALATAEDFAEVANTPVQPSAPESPIPTPASAEEDATFILKHAGNKRKRASEATPSTDAMATQNNEVSLDDPALDALQAKATRKAARKAAKLASKGTPLPTDMLEADEAPFDYAAAPSILNPPRETKEAMKERRKKEVDPYVKKSLDAPRGMPRARREGGDGGRSVTYRS